MHGVRMLFKHAAVFPFSGIPFDSMEAALKRQVFTPCLPSAAGSHGFVPPVEGVNALTHVVGQVVLFAMREDEKILPSCVVNAELALRVQKISTTQMRRVGRKERASLKNLVTEALRAKAFIRTTVTYALLDFKSGLLIVDSSCDGRIEGLISLLSHQFDVPPAIHCWNTNEAPAGHFTHWVQSGEPPALFSIDDCALLTHPEGGTVRLTGQNVLAQDFRPLLESGRSCVELALTFDEQVSFTLTQNLRLKRLTHLGISPQKDPTQLDLLKTDLSNAEIILSAGTVSKLFAEFSAVLGGLRPPEILPETKPQREGDEKNDELLESDPLYSQARHVVLSTGRVSISLVQRQLCIGYNRAARLIEQMEKERLVSKPGDRGERTVLAA